jgi:hypothetical protein
MNEDHPCQKTGTTATIDKRVNQEKLKIQDSQIVQG